jgi:outer membrane immunogenic protein
MKRLITLIAGALLLALVASAQEQPKFETFVGYTFMRTDLQSNNTTLDLGSFSMEGGSAQFIYNFNKRFSGVVDVGAVHRGNISVLDVEDRRAFFTVGPRFAYRSSSRWTPYFEVLLGASERSATKELSVITGPNAPEPPVVTPHDPFFPGPGVEITASLKASQTDFAFMTGGGVDFRVSKHFTFRPIAVDYVLTTFPSLLTGDSAHQNGLRATIGFVFTFGKEQ